MGWRIAIMGEQGTVRASSTASLIDRDRHDRGGVAASTTRDYASANCGA
jgi:hypothetical protein